jgi:type I restriction enzyme S subunit
VPARSLLNARYLQYWLQSVRGDLRGAGTGSTFQELASETLLATQLPLPPVHEQRRIANFLDEQVAGLDRATIAAGEMTELLEERARADLISAVLAFGDQSRVKSPVPWAPSLPKHWPVVKLNLIARMGSGHTPSRSSPELWLNPTISWLTTNDVHRFRRDEIDELDAPALSISEEGLANSAAVLHPAGTVALSRTASAGFSIVMGQAMATSQDFVTWTCGPLLLPHYLLAVLRASRQDLLGRLAMGSTHKTIYFPDLEAIRVPLPPIEEQDAAVQQVRELSAFHRAVRERLTDLRAVLEERKRALITACVTGEFDVSTASDRAGDAALAGVRV